MIIKPSFTMRSSSPPAPQASSLPASPPPLPGVAARELTLPKTGKCMPSLAGSPRSVTVGCGYSWGCRSHRASVRPVRLGPWGALSAAQALSGQEPSRRGGACPGAYRLLGCPRPAQPGSLAPLPGPFGLVGVGATPSPGC